MAIHKYPIAYNSYDHNYPICYKSYTLNPMIMAVAPYKLGAGQLTRRARRQSQNRDDDYSIGYRISANLVECAWKSR